MAAPIAFRNVVRYNRNVEKNVRLYEALGFKPMRVMEGFAILQNEEGVKLILHEGEPDKDATNVTALGFTMTTTPEEARRHVEAGGWTLLREPDEADEGFFYIYGDLDGNPINLVGQRHG